jgi:hypothetical protein
MKYLYKGEIMDKKKTSVLSYHRDGKPVRNRVPFQKDEVGIMLPEISARFTEYMAQV